MFKKIICTLTICLSVMAGSAWAQTYHVLDTGDPSERVCNPKSYTDLSNGIVRDNVTGLEWVQDGNLIASRDPSFDNDTTSGDGEVNWQHALDYIALLNADNYLGYSDWRLPTVEELSTLVNAGISDPAIDPVFDTVSPTHYWSSTPGLSSLHKCWCVSSKFGNVLLEDDIKLYHVRAVRAGQSGSVDSFVIKGDGTVTDTNTGLMWQQCNYGQTWAGAQCTDSAGSLTWDEAFVYVQGLNDTDYLGYDDWRLPTRNELQSLMDYSVYNPSTVFPNMVTTYYWSSTTETTHADMGWPVSFSEGEVNYLNKDKNICVRAVRAGQCRSFGDWCIDDSDCDDGVFCNGAEICDNNTCFVSIDPCDNSTLLCDEANERCVECFDWYECDDDGLYCTGDPECVDGACGFTGDPCDNSSLVCDEANNQCVDCLEDTDCAIGYICENDICVPGGFIQIDKCKVKAGKNGKGDSIQFSGLIDANEADLMAADDIIVTIESVDIPDLNETTFIFPITYIKKGKYKSPKDKTIPQTSLKIDSLKGKMKFKVKGADLTGLSCPITVKFQIGDYVAEEVLEEDIVNGTKKLCPPELI